MSGPPRSTHRTAAFISLMTLACLLSVLATAGAAALCIRRLQHRRQDEDGLTPPGRAGASGKYSAPAQQTLHGANGATSNKLGPAGHAAAARHASEQHTGAGFGVEEAPAVPAGYGSTSLSPIFVPIARARSI